MSSLLSPFSLGCRENCLHGWEAARPVTNHWEVSKVWILVGVGEVLGDINPPLHSGCIGYTK